MNELITLTADSIEVVKGNITFKGYEKLKEEALSLAERIRQTEVSDENIKEIKKELAGVNKSVKFLEDARISIKKTMLEPYNDFEAQIKEIVAIVKESDEVVRAKVRELEEIEREEKKAEIKAMFENKLVHYEFKNFINFEDFYHESMANKTTSMGVLEEQASQWLESINNDINAINTMEHSDEILNEYKQNLSLAMAINIVRRRHEEVKKVNETIKKDYKIKNTYIYIVEDEKDSKLLEMLMKENNIKFRKEVR